MEKIVVSVSDAIALLNQTLDYAYPSLTIEGEVSSFAVNQGKYVFFDLKDATGTLNCFMMVFQLRTSVEDGMRVRIVATPKVTAWGKLSMTVRDVQPVGEGSLQRAFNLLKQKLDKEGLFATDRKRSLPVYPHRIAVISSVQAAGYADFIRILNERWGGITVCVANVRVQGVEAPDQIIRALHYCNELEPLPEVIVLLRGGGSADDLRAFNDEYLVRAIATSRVPTVVGVGHEVDTSLADLAADVRAATPTHAAHIIVPDKREQLAMVRQTLLRIARAVDGAVSELSLNIDHLLDNTLRTMDERVTHASTVLAERQAMLFAYDPDAILARGYAIVRGDVVVGGTIEIEQHRLSIEAEVRHVKEK